MKRTIYVKRNVFKFFICAIIVSLIILLVIVWFSFKYKTRPNTIRENVWDTGQKVSEKYLDSIKDMKSIKLIKVNDVELINPPKKKNYKFIKDNEKYEGWIYEDFYNIRKKEQGELTDDEKMVIREVADVYEALRSCDEAIREYDVLKCKESLTGDKNISNDMIKQKKDNILDSVSKLKIRTSKLENIYGFEYSIEIDKVLRIINEKL